ncbi:MAG: acetate kinase [Clostridia bacterium]|nr:acetate kinase [Clostridia bacterium]
MKILVINAGSSSLKYQLIDMDTNNVMAKGLCERIGIEGSLLTHQAGGEKYPISIEMKDHSDAINAVINALISKEHGVIADMSEISAVGHRVVHGGEEFSGSVIITEAVKNALEACIELAPLHNPPNLTGIAACEKAMPGVPQVAVFDTAFHQSMPASSYLYPLPYEYYEKYKVRRYGFHGTSHKYVTQRAASMLGKKAEELKIITCHLGNGSSITAVNGGKSMDTTMGFTPLAGTLMGTRCGDIDPAIVTYIINKEGKSAEEVDSIMNKKSGIYGVSGVSSDFRDVAAAAADGNKRAEVGLKMFYYEIKKFIGAYAAAMNGVDAIVFTAGIGENDKTLRKEVTSGLSFLGVEIDDEKNSVRGEEIDISASDAKVKTLVIPTNEELMIALDTKEIVENL